eukprot:677243_1
MDDLENLVQELHVDTILKNRFIKAVVKLNNITKQSVMGDNELKSWLATNQLTKISVALVDNDIECLDDIKDALKTMDDLENLVQELHVDTILKNRFIKAVVKLNNITKQSVMGDNELKSWLATNKLTQIDDALVENDIECLEDIKDALVTMEDLNSFVGEMGLNTTLKNTFIKAVVKLNKITDISNDNEFASWLETNKLTKIADALAENDIECLDDIKDGLETMDDLEDFIEELHVNTALKNRFINAVAKLNNIPNQSHNEETKEDG